MDPSKVLSSTSAMPDTAKVFCSFLTYCSAFKLIEQAVLTATASARMAAPERGVRIAGPFVAVTIRCNYEFH